MTGRRRTRSFLPARIRTLRGPGGGPRTPREGARSLPAGALAACAALLAGCGVVPGSGSTTDGPVVVMTWAPEKTAATDKPGMPAMAKAYARWVNSRGGINGRPLEVHTCNDRNDTVGAARCAQRAVDEGAVAVVGSYSRHGRSALSPLESAGIPYIGGYGATDEEFTSLLSYPVNGGQPALLAGLGRQLSRACGPVVLVRPDTLNGDPMPVLLDAGLRAGKHDAAVDHLASDTATAYGEQSRRALERATADPARQGCVVPSLGGRTGTFMDSFRRDREDFPAVRLGSVLGSVDQSVIDASGGRSGPYEGAYVTGWYPQADDPRWDPMKKVIRAHAFDDNRIDPTDPGVQTTWIAYGVLRTVVERLGDGEVSARTVRRTLNKGLRVTTGGLTPPLRWRLDDLATAGGHPRLVNANVTYQVVREGRLTPSRKGFVNVLPTLENAR